MTAIKRIITRRDFIRAGSSAVMGGLIGFPLFRNVAGQTTQKSRVVLIRNRQVTKGYGTLDHNLAAEMLDQAVTTLLNASSPSELNPE